MSKSSRKRHNYEEYETSTPKTDFTVVDLTFDAPKQKQNRLNVASLAVPLSQAMSPTPIASLSAVGDVAASLTCNESLSDPGREPLRRPRVARSLHLDTLTTATGPVHLAGPGGFMKNALGGPVHFLGTMPLLSQTFSGSIPNPDYESDNEVATESVKLIDTGIQTDNDLGALLVATTPTDASVQTQDEGIIVGESLVAVLQTTMENQRLIIEGKCHTGPFTFP